MDNLNLLKYSVSQPEDFLDGNYMFVKKHKDLDLYASRMKEIKKILMAISREKDHSASGELYQKLSGVLEEYANSSEFGCFINACDVRIEYAAANLPVLKKIVWLYLKNRDLRQDAPTEWIQAIIDKGANRNLEKNKNNFFVNTAGFEKLFNQPFN